VKQLNAKTRLKVKSGAVCFFTNAKEIRQGISDCPLFNIAMQQALIDLEASRTPEDGPIISISGTWQKIPITLETLPRSDREYF
jgi:hypothetical protein